MKLHNSFPEICFAPGIYCGDNGTQYSGTFSMCSQHVKFTSTHSPAFHACIFYMGKYYSHAGMNDAHV